MPLGGGAILMSIRMPRIDKKPTGVCEQNKRLFFGTYCMYVSKRREQNECLYFGTWCVFTTLGEETVSVNWVGAEQWCSS